MNDNKLTRKGHTWNWERFHKWKNRGDSKVEPQSIIGKNTKVFTMGSCFAQNVAKFLNSKAIYAHSFPETTHFNTVSVCQDLIHLLEKEFYADADMWTTDMGLFANPFRKPTFRANSMEELSSWNFAIDRQARAFLTEADVIIVTLGGTEIWRNPETKKVYLTIPYPDIFNTQMPQIAEYYNLNFEENYTALEQIYHLLRKYIPRAHIIMTVSPNRMTFTVSEKDVVLANSQAKSILRAAVGRLTDRYKEKLSYFHSYEIVEYALYPSDLLDHQQRHVNSFAITVVMNEFMRCFFESNLFDKAKYELLQEMLKKREGQLNIESIPFKSRIKKMALNLLKLLKLKSRYYFSKGKK